jgi:hypothetical protein
MNIIARGGITCDFTGWAVPVASLFSQVIKKYYVDCVPSWRLKQEGIPGLTG